MTEVKLFKLRTKFEPKGDQPEAIEKLTGKPDDDEALTAKEASP